VVVVEGQRHARAVARGEPRVTRHARVAVGVDGLGAAAGGEHGQADGDEDALHGFDSWQLGSTDATTRFVAPG
jgi:hypothetical protein